MPSMTSTTLSAAVTANADIITVASATGFNAANMETATPASLIYIDAELMQVIAVSSTTITVKRGVAGINGPHASGAVVWVGAPNEFTAKEKAGYESSTPTDKLPVIDPAKGIFYTNVGGYWYSQLSSFKAHKEMWDLVGDGAPTDGTSGTGAGIAGPGSTYMDFTNQVLYTNTNTKASPTWTVVGSQS